MKLNENGSHYLNKLSNYPVNTEISGFCLSTLNMCIQAPLNYPLILSVPSLIKVAKSKTSVMIFISGNAVIYGLDHVVRIVSCGVYLLITAHFTGTRYSIKQ